MNIALKYLRANWLFAAVFLYMLFSCILKIATGINITIPCLFSIILGFHCPGCGLTTAATQLLQLHFYKAWEHNPIIFIVIPAGIAYIINDFLRFKKKTTITALSN